jgi:hypothetical protein
MKKLLALVGVFFVFSAARAQVVDLRLQGTINSVSNVTKNAPFNLGDAFTWDIYIDYSAAPSSSTATNAFYHPFAVETADVLKIGGYSSIALKNISLTTHNNSVFGDGYQIDGFDLSDVSEVGARLWTNNLGLLSSIYLPLVSGFPLDRDHYIFINGKNNDASLAFTAQGNITSYTVIPVPEPSTYGLVGGCMLVGLLALRRVRSRK